ncbi:endonuclease/exonuclease/phosphatase family protein [Opitutaceae bacterium EW11]|nr:endonuclease/exonuclease/phosphatase family protein [Opitutaceae bacterium EW11]
MTAREATRGIRLAKAWRGLWIGVVIVAACAAARAEQLTVATYNLENYLATDRFFDGAYRRGFPKPEAEKTALRAVIRAANADVLAVEELGARPYLKELQRDLRRDGCDYPYAELLEADDPDRHVAVLSRRPFASVTRHTDLKLKYFGAQEAVKRGLLEVRFAVAGGEVAVFIVHLKSRFTDRSDDPLSAVRRAGEAEAIRDRVLQRFPEPQKARFLIVGDFNDAPGSRPLRALCQRGSVRIGEPLPAEDSRGETWTHRFRKEDSYSRVDYVVVSPGLKDAVAAGRARIVDVLPQTRDASDHRPVLVTLQLPDVN